MGDSADGYPGISGIGKIGAAQLLNEYGPIESFPPNILSRDKENALLFKHLATLRKDIKLFKNVDQLKWKGPTPEFASVVQKLEEPKLLTRVNEVYKKIA